MILSKKELHILGDFNINLHQNENQSSNTLFTEAVSNDVTNYLQYCSIFGLIQIESPSHITCSSTSLIDHILAYAPERSSQEGVRNVGYQTTGSFIALRKLVELKLEMCTKKLNSIYLRIMQFDAYEKTVIKTNFSKYKYFEDQKCKKTKYKI